MSDALFIEKLTADLLIENPNCEILRGGWPDLVVVCKDTGRLVKAVEGKDVGDYLRDHQQKLHGALRSAGVRVETWYKIGNTYRIK